MASLTRWMVCSHWGGGRAEEQLQCSVRKETGEWRGCERRREKEGEERREGERVEKGEGRVNEREEGSGEDGLREWESERAGGAREKAFPHKESVSSPNTGSV